MEELPQYARSSSSHRNPHTGAASLRFAASGRRTPAQRSPRAPSEHLYHLTNSRGCPWLTLKVISNAPASNYLPAFFEGEPIAGSVTLHREKEDSIKSISVQIVGQMTSSVEEVLNFVQVSETLWSASASESSSSSNSQTLNSLTPNNEPQMPHSLVGDYSWSFSLTLPKECDIKSPSTNAQTFPLPGSFSERMTRVHIQYQLIATVHRKRFRVDSTLGTVIGYCPIIRPDAPSMLRQIAYLEGAHIPGPDADPDGWKYLDPLHIRGSVFSTRTVDARCLFALAKPVRRRFARHTAMIVVRSDSNAQLCYTRGSVIPCVMTIETTDPQALDLLSAPRSLVVRLRRSVATPAGMLDRKKLPALDFETDVQDVSTAVWQPDSVRAPQTRVLHGEIHLPATLKPTSCLGKFELTYSVAVYPPKAVAFQPDDGGNIVMQQEPVVIGTVYPPGPRPRIYSPPGYDDASSMGQSSQFRIFR